MKIPYLLFTILLLAILSGTTSCNIQDKKTTFAVYNPHRHYYPVLQGQVLQILYPIENTGNEPLFITDIQTSCGCLLVDESSFKVLPVGGKGFIRLDYDSNKNVGYVKHYIMIRANLETNVMQELTFDLNVVPDALYTKDYEELHNNNKVDKYIDDQALVNGIDSEKRYYTDEEEEA